MAWTLLSPYIVSCPAENPRIAFQNFPALNITVRFTIYLVIITLFDVILLRITHPLLMNLLHLQCPTISLLYQLPVVSFYFPGKAPVRLQATTTRMLRILQLVNLRQVGSLCVWLVKLNFVHSSSRGYRNWIQRIHLSVTSLVTLEPLYNRMEPFSEVIQPPS